MRSVLPIKWHDMSQNCDIVTFDNSPSIAITTSSNILLNYFNTVGKVAKVWNFSSLEISGILCELMGELYSLQKNSLIDRLHGSQPMKLSWPGLSTKIWRGLCFSYNSHAKKIFWKGWTLIPCQYCLKVYAILQLLS